MKKKITRPDGTVEEIEGTVEELAELERRQREGLSEVPQKKGKKILLEDVKKAFEDTIRKSREEIDPLWPIWASWPHCGPSCQVCRPYQITFSGTSSGIDLPKIGASSFSILSSYELDHSEILG